MTEKLFTGTLNHNQNKQTKQTLYLIRPRTTWRLFVVIKIESFIEKRSRNYFLPVSHLYIDHRKDFLVCFVMVSLYVPVNTYGLVGTVISDFV